MQGGQRNLQKSVKHAQSFDVAVAVAVIVGSFSIDDGDGSENVTFKMNSRFFKLCRGYSYSLKMSNVGEFPWS